MYPDTNRRRRENRWGKQRLRITDGEILREFKVAENLAITAAAAVGITARAYCPADILRLGRSDDGEEEQAEESQTKCAIWYWSNTTRLRRRIEDERLGVFDRRSHGRGMPEI